MLFGATYINYISTEKDREDNYYFHFLENRNEKWCDAGVQERKILRKSFKD